MLRKAATAEALPWTGERRARGGIQEILRLTRRKPLGVFGAAVVLLLVVLAIFAPLVAPYDPKAFAFGDKLQAPSASHWFGSDEVGRDVFSRVVYGARISLMVGFAAVGMGTATGSILGIVCGYFGGKVDMVIQRIADSIMAFPGLVFLLTILAVFGTGLPQSMIAIGVLMWPQQSRIVRGATLAMKHSTYMEAARAIGATDLRILVRHVLPNVAAPIIIVASVMLGAAILLETSLSFLGLGAKPPTPSWGLMLSGQGRQNMERAPWLAVAPGLAITVAVLGFNLFGDALRDIWDPRLRGSQ